MNCKRIIAVHLLNDFSGSPFVLKQALCALEQKGHAVHLFTATPSGCGVLSNIPGVKEHSLFYRWHKNKLLTLFFFLYSQAVIFFRLLFFLKRNDTVYVNSILPFGAALAAKLRRCHVLYHIHEVSVKPVLLKRFLLFIVSLTAQQVIFVSDDLRKRTSLPVRHRIIYNALPDEFVLQAVQSPGKASNGFTVLMLCSLKEYKGVKEFAACAVRLPQFTFQLVLNANEKEITTFFSTVFLPPNLQLLPAQRDVHAWYRQADVVMNLSRPDEWVETFGMTVLEALYYRKPVIVPPVGGVTELITDGVEGFCISAYEVEAICNKLLLLHACPQLYRQMSVQAYRKAQQFTSTCFAKQITAQVQLLYKEDADKLTSPALQPRLF